MKISKNSWHYKLILESNNLNGYDMPQNILSYLITLLWILFGLAFISIIVLIASPFWLFGAQFYTIIQFFRGYNFKGNYIQFCFIPILVFIEAIMDTLNKSTFQIKEFDFKKREKTILKKIEYVD